jgi:hypothetical protein
MYVKNAREDLLNFNILCKILYIFTHELCMTEQKFWALSVNIIATKQIFLISNISTHDQYTKFRSPNALKSSPKQKFNINAFHKLIEQRKKNTS